MENKKEICFLIPIYPPHYCYLDFLDDLDGSTITFDIYFILTSYQDKLKLDATPYNKIYKVIILEDTININILYTSSIVTFKKFYGLQYIEQNYSQYKYIAVTDAEIKFYNTSVINEKFTRFTKQKQIIGASMNGIGIGLGPYDIQLTVNRNCATFFNGDNYKRLNELTKGFTFNFWFSDIPIYDVSLLCDFFKFINFNDSNYIYFLKLDNLYFEYTIYVFYIILFKEYKLIDTKEFNITRDWSLEACPYSTYLQVVEKTGYTPSWLIGDAYDSNKTALPDIIMTYHRNSPLICYIHDT